MLYGPDGSRVSSVRQVRYRPEPNVEIEAKIREQLKSMDSLLDIKWFPYAIFNKTHNDFEGRYALICNWPQGDGRWELYQKGEIEDHCDMLGWWCEDIHDANSMPVSPDSIDRKVMELLGKCDGNRLPHTKRMKQIMDKNAKLRSDRKKEILDQAGEISRDLHYIAGHREEASLQRIFKEIVKEAKREG